MYPKPTIVSDLYPRIFTDPAIRRQLSKREETRSRTDYYNQILSSITLDELNRNLIEKESRFTPIFIYSYEIDKLGNLTFKCDAYGASFHNNSIKYILFDEFSIKQNLDGKYSQIFYDFDRDYKIEDLKNKYYGSNYYFDLETIEGILIKRRIYRNTRYQLLKMEYDKIKNDLKNYSIPFYLYINQYDSAPGELARDLEIDEKYDDININDYIPDYENEIKKFDNKNIEYIEIRRKQ